MKQITQLKHPIAKQKELLDIMFAEIKKGVFTDPTRGTTYIDSQMVQKIMQPIFDKIKINYTVISAWIHFMLPGSNHELGHNHAVDIGVYYLKVTETSGNLFFNNLNIEITPEVGLFLIVPATEIHSMLENKSNQIRIALGMELKT